MEEIPLTLKQLNNEKEYVEGQYFRLSFNYVNSIIRMERLFKYKSNLSAFIKSNDKNMSNLRYSKVII